MLTFTAGCVCNSEALQTANQDNLLFAGQILPETNGGLAGTPTAKFNQTAPFVAAVFNGQGRAGARAACFAAGAFRGVAPKLHSEQDLATLLVELHDEFSAKAPEDTGVAALAISVSADRLCMANFGACRAYLFRDRALHLLSRKESNAVLGDPALTELRPYTISGALHSGDQLLLCTDGLYSVLDDPSILRILATESTVASFLQALLQTAWERGVSDTVTAILLRFD